MSGSGALMPQIDPELLAPLLVPGRRHGRLRSHLVDRDRGRTGGRYAEALISQIWLDIRIGGPGHRRTRAHTTMVDGPT